MPNSNPIPPHKLRPTDGSEPNWTLLVKGKHGQYSHNVAFRQGEQADAYIDMRKWCWNNGLNFSDMLNSIIVPMLYMCENFARRDGKGNILITMNFGDVAIEQVYIPRTPKTSQYGPKAQKSKANKVIVRLTLF